MEVWSALKTLKSNIVITTHYMEEARELSDDVVLIDNGKKVAQGSTPALLAQFHGKLRVEGPKGKYGVGSTRISYMEPSKAKRLVSQGYSAKQVTLEDLFIINGGGTLED